MSKAIGIIINPMAGRDIRRIVADAEYITHYTKINFAKRFILGLDSVDSYEIYIMPDNYGISEEVVDSLRNKINSSIKYIDILVRGTVEDTIRTARIMREIGVNIIASFGGDGTLRAVFKGAGVIPIVGVPLGTNNVMSRTFLEPTVLGVVTGLALKNLDRINDFGIQLKILKLYMNKELRDTALIDIAFIPEGWIGARAIWDITNVKYIVFSKCEPTDIGLASIGGNIHPISFYDENGLFVEIEGENRAEGIRAIIAPGLIKKVRVRNYVIFNKNVEIPSGRYAIAFDGERELVSQSNDRIEIQITRGGPILIDPLKVLAITLSKNDMLHNQANIGN